MTAAIKRLYLAGLGLRQEVRSQIGVTGMLGGAALTVALLGLALPVSDWRDDTRTLQQDTRRLMRELERNQSRQARTLGLNEQLKRFNAWFPGIDRNADDLRLISEQAELAGLELDKGEYQVSSAAGATFVNFEAELPVKAEYAAVRSFIGGVLSAVPNASLSELRIERPSANSKVLDARVHFTLVYRGA